MIIVLSISLSISVGYSKNLSHLGGSLSAHNIIQSMHSFEIKSGFINPRVTEVDITKPDFNETVLWCSQSKC